MSSAIIRKKNNSLSVEKLPTVISSDEEHIRVMRIVSELMSRHLTLNPKEGKLLRTLAKLVAAYEQTRFTYLSDPGSPLQMLKFNMENHGHTAKDLWDVIGDKGTTSKVLSGKRAISKAMAKRLGEFYHLSPALFI